MSDDTIHAIQDHQLRLDSLYFDHREIVQQLQNALLTQILPNVVDELGLDKAARDLAEEWLHDDLSIFRTLKRHKFTKAFALESLRSALIWRISLKAQDPSAFPSSALHVLPPPATDILGRPILILRLADLANLQKDPREHILRTVEGLRIRLHSINPSSPPGSPMSSPVLQYMLLVDMENASLRNFNLDLLTWYIHEVAPRYPGMFGTVFVINFSWTQSGIWTIIRLALPESVQYRIFFPSKETLHKCIPPSSLPQDYGGLLPFLSEIPNMLDVPQTTTLTPSPSASLSSSLNEEEASGASPSLTHALGDNNTAARSTCRKIASLAHVSPRSQCNPFYGYPIGPSSHSSMPPAALPYLRYGRRRKRDLIRTLAALWWEKWRSRVSWTTSLLFVFFCVRWWWRQRRNSMFLIRREPH